MLLEQGWTCKKNATFMEDASHSLLTNATVFRCQTCLGPQVGPPCRLFVGSARKPGSESIRRVSVWSSDVLFSSLKMTPRDPLIRLPSQPARTRFASTLKPHKLCALAPPSPTICRPAKYKFLCIPRNEACSQHRKDTGDTLPQREVCGCTYLHSHSVTCAFIHCHPTRS